MCICTHGQLVVEVWDQHDKLVKFEAKAAREGKLYRATVAERLEARGVLRNPVALTIGDHGQPAHWAPSSPDLQHTIRHGGRWRHHTEPEQKAIVDIYGNANLDLSHTDRNFPAHRAWLRKLNAGRGTRLGCYGSTPLTHGIWAHIIADTRRCFREDDFPPGPGAQPRVHATATFEIGRASIRVRSGFAPGTPTTIGGRWSASTCACGG